MKCRRCGCDEQHACDLGDLGPCWWVAHELCSRCALAVLGRPKHFATVLLALTLEQRTCSELGRAIREDNAPATVAKRMLALLRALKRDELVHGLTNWPVEERRAEQQQKPKPAAAARARARARG